MTTLKVFASREYGIHIGKGLLKKAGKLLNLNRRVFIMTDAGVPKEYAEKIKNECLDGYIFTLPSGEGTKSISCFERALSEMARLGFSRSDCVVAVGGGVIGDLAGFVAASYMRGVEFYNVPTTTLSQLDSSIGGKVAINLSGVKNIVGAFYQPSSVLIDTDTLKTLDKRQYASGLCEAVKMAMTSNENLFSYFEENEINDSNIDYVICEALKIKKAIVEADEREGGVRKILNFGHTYGHAVESLSGMRDYYHGECVSLGMIPMCSESARERLLPVLKKLSLPTSFTPDFKKLEAIMSHDKKANGDFVEAVFVESVGSCEIRKISIADLTQKIKEAVEGGK